MFVHRFFEARGLHLSTPMYRAQSARDSGSHLSGVADLCLVERPPDDQSRGCSTGSFEMCETSMARDVWQGASFFCIEQRSLTALHIFLNIRVLVIRVLFYQRSVMRFFCSNA